VVEATAACADPAERRPIVWYPTLDLELWTNHKPWLHPTPEHYSMTGTLDRTPYTLDPAPCTQTTYLCILKPGQHHEPWTLR